MGVDVSTIKFLSTSSARRTTHLVAAHGQAKADFYPRPPRGGRQRRKQQQRKEQAISIHVLREEDDCISFCVITPDFRFLSTSSARRTTGKRQFLCRRNRHFYPRPPRGGRPFLGGQDIRFFGISIHVLREEDDCNVMDLYAHDSISIHVLREEDDVTSCRME